MVQINFAQKQVNAKIVYYGPGMSGKTTNLEVIHQRAPESNRGDLTSISTDGDRTLFFDFMPLDLGMVAGMRTCFQVYTVPGQVYYNSTRKLVLQGVDGVIFIADSSPDMMEENLESMRDLQKNLAEYGRSAEEIPLVIQYNKRDIPGALPIEELEEQLNTRGVPAFEGIANTGQGVFPTLKAVAACVLDSLHKQSGAAGGAAPEVAPAADAQPMPAQAAQPEAPIAQPTPGEAQPQAPSPLPPPTAQPAGDASGERQTISMSQTGFHKAPSLPLQGAAAPEPVASTPQAAAPQPTATPPPEPVASEAAPAAAGLQMKAPEPAQSEGLQMAPPATPQPAMSPPAAVQPTAAVQPPVPQAQVAQPQAATGTMAPAQPAQPAAYASAGSVMAVEASAAAKSAPRRAPAPKSFPSRAPEAHATPKSGKKSAFMTMVIVVASVGLGAAIGSFVLSVL